MQNDDLETQNSDNNLESLRLSRESRLLTNPFEHMGGERLGLTIKWRVESLTVTKNKAKIPCLQRGHPYKKDILRGIQGSAWRGELIAVIGDSGAGKSAFFHSLSGRNMKGEAKGEILLDSRKRNQDWFRRTCMIPSRTVFDDWLTVEETVLIAGLLKSPSSMSREIVRENVEKVLELTHMTQFRDYYVGYLPDSGISGGENSRLALAAELVTDPEMLFFDHEMFGMSGESIRQTAMELRNLAHIDGRIVFIALSQHHLPVLDLVDKVFIFAQGQALFYGSTRFAYKYFQKQGYGSPIDPVSTDFLLGLASVNRTSLDLRKSTQDRINALTLSWKRNRRRNSTPSKPEYLRSVYASGAGGVLSTGSQRGSEPSVQWTKTRFQEFRVLLERESLIRFRNRWNVVLTLIQPLLYGIIVGFAYFQLDTSRFGILGRLNLLQLLPKMQYFFFTFPLVYNILTFRPIVHRERSGMSYHALSQYLASFLASLPMFLFYTFLMSFTMYYVPGLRTDGFQYFVCFLGLLLVNTVTAVCFAYFVAGISSNSDYVAIYVSTLIIVMFIFSGGVPKHNWVLRWLQYIFPVYYANSGLLYNEFYGNPMFVNPTGEQILMTAGFGAIDLGWSFGGLLILAAVYLFLGYFTNEKVTRPKFHLI